jgi:hypothetical protein
MTRIIAGARESETKKKLLATSPFPSLQATVNFSRSEESARAKERTLSGNREWQLYQQSNFNQTVVHPKATAVLEAGYLMPRGNLGQQAASHATHAVNRIIFILKDLIAKRIEVERALALALNPKWHTSLSEIFRQITSVVYPLPSHCRC